MPERSVDENTNNSYQMPYDENFNLHIGGIHSHEGSPRSNIGMNNDFLHKTFQID